jgi:predicted dehydrogenase
VTSPLRIGVIGAGSFGKRHIAAYARRSDVEVTGIVDRDPERAQAVARDWGVEHWFTETADLLASCRPQGVSVVTSGADHLAPTLEALAVGCSVLLEKPVTLTTREAKELTDAEARSNGFVMPAHILRFAGPYRELQARVRAGELGRVLAIATVRDRGRDHEQLFAGVHPALMTTIHDIDLAIWLTGSRAKQVRALGRGGDADAPRLVWADVESVDGSIWSLRVSWLLSDDAPASDRLEVYGDRGVAKLELRPSVAVFTDRTVWVDHELTPDAHPGALDAEIDCFCARIRSPTDPPVVTLAEARHGVEIAEAIIRSIAHGGATIELPG